MGAQIILIIVAILLQEANAFAVFGVRPNLALSILVPLIFFTKDWRFFLVLILVSGIFLGMAPGFQLSSVVFMALVFGAYLLNKLTPWRSYFMNFIFLAALTTLFNLPRIFFGEMVYNVVLGILFFYLLSYWYEA